MNIKRILIQICLLSLSFSFYGQSNELKLHSDYDYAKKELQKALTDKNQNNYVYLKNVIIVDSVTAVAIAEPILFGIYGKEEILNEKPYKIFHIDNYWILEGTLNYDVGGVFLIIIDDRNSQVIKIIHGK
jgi:hypothetical protein